MADTPKRPLRQEPHPNARQSLGGLIAAHAALLDPLYAQSGAARWQLQREPFLAALSRCISKAVPSAAQDSVTVERLLAGLHLEDLALACACAEGQESAWEHFVATYRGYLRSAAAVILHCRAGSPEATELADSLFAELYGVAEGKRGQGGLFRYFHGRSSLKTWLRAVLAQRHIDRIRATRRFTNLDDGETSAAVESSASPRSHQPADPHRDRYIGMFHRALQGALHSLDPRDSLRLTHYYRDDKTLAEIGRLLGEHESSVSRNLERVRRELRAAVEATLRAGFPVINGSSAEPGLSDAEIALCLEYAAEDSGIDLDTLFPAGSQSHGSEPGRKQS
jgi:RNA polymerase sigma factor (sigma-70 family)